MTNHDAQVNVALESLEASHTDVAAAVHAGSALAGPRTLVQGADRFYTQLIPAGGQLKIIDVDELEEKYRDRPRRKTGTVHVHSAESFIAYLEKHAIPETEVWADLSTQKLVGVVNAHQEATSTEDATAADNGAGFGDHRLQLELVKTDAWKAWVGKDRQWLDQVSFAEHIEDNAIDVVTPDSATMLEIAESFQATTKVEFKSAQRLHDGQVALNYEEDQGAKAGEKGDIEIPKSFLLELTPFEGSQTYQVEARFRYRIRGAQGLALSYHLVRPDDVLRQAFIDYVTAVDNEITAPVFRGRPE